MIGAKVQTGGRPTARAPGSTRSWTDTPAEESGLQKGDVITEVDGERVTDGIALIVAIRTHQPGETIEFTVVRDGEEQTVEITLGAETG